MLQFGLLYMKLEGAYSKEVRRWIEKIRMPSGQCQSCLSDKTTDKDYMLTCSVCQSSIHNKHYGKEISEPSPQSLEVWKCERCRIITETQIDLRPGQIESFQCHFCPNKRGILKRVIFNSTQTIWLHPQCLTWSHPIVFQKNKKRTHYFLQYPSKPTGCFWVNLYDQQSAPCQICNDSFGYKIKCIYYTCRKYYHSSCAKSNGFIRDLESMHFQNQGTYIPPYCEEHLNLRIKDCAVKRNKYKSLGDENKASHFNQMMQGYKVQWQNMLKSAQKFKAEEQIRLQMQYQTGEKEDLIQEISFQNNSNSFHSEHPQSFIQQIFDNDFPTTNTKLRPLLFKPQLSPVHHQSMINQEFQMAEEIKEELVPQLLPAHTSMERMINLQRPKNKASPRESDNEESQWQNNFDLQDHDEDD